ncbi:MAG: hypothetical protein ABI541_06480 [Betaproteobacteria bacterium]
MRKNPSSDHGAIAEPAPLYASDAEIEQQLRHQLEQRYLGGPSEAPSPLRDRKGDNH